MDLCSMGCKMISSVGFDSWSVSAGKPTVDGAVVLFWNGFESRSTKFLREAELSGASSFYCFKFTEDQFDLSLNNQTVKERVPADRLTFLLLDRRDQFQSYKKFYDLFETIAIGVRIVFDITCFPRDILLIVLFALWKTGRVESVSCVYNLALDYSIGSSKADKWLSKGVSQVSPVIGYRGVVRPDRPLQLIALVGFDDQRILQIADILSPDSLVFGYGETKLLGRDWLIAQSLAAAESLTVRFEESSVVSFICEDGANVFALSDGAVENRPDYNHVVVPMNNKISTLFAGTYCMANRSVQICYGGGLIYNHSDYSTESAVFYTWTFVSK